MTSLFGGGAKAVSKTPTRAMGIDLQGSQYGPPIPVVFGQNKVAGNVIWYGDFKATSHTQKQPGKGGGGSSSTSYTYSCSFELGLCEGVANVVNVYQGSSTVSLSRSGGIAFSGTTGQAAWSHLTGSAALGYSGTALAAFQNLELGSSASLPNFNFEVAARNQFGGGVVDANPADIVTAICTDTQIGVGFSALGDLTAFKNYCTAAGIFFSPVYSTQNPAHQTLDDLFKYANAAPFFSEGVLKVVPYGDATITGNGVTYTPNTTAVVDLGRDDFITNGPGDPVTIHRISPADAMNLVRVEYKDRANTYHTNAVVASIDQDVVGTGSRADQSESVDMITQAAVARLVAQNLLQRIYYIRNAYQFQLSWRYCYLEPMDVVTLTDANTGLYLTPVRITEIGEDEHGLLSVTAEEFPDGVSHGGTYGTQANSGATVDPNADPGPIDAPYLFRGPGFLVSNAQPEIWCAITGNSALWAGCDVYISHDGTSYSYLATSSKSAAYGHLTNTLASAADPDTTGAPNVVLNGAAQLLGGSAADADQFITLAMVDSELIAYQTATLASGPSYTLGYLRRGGYGSAIASHAANAPFVRLDDNILRIPVDPSQIGQTVYLKFVSFNVFGRGGRTLADETAYTYVIGTNIELPDVPVTPASFTATGVADGVALTWTNPNPAAVGSTSIEYATASGGPWTVLAQVGATTTAYAHHFTNGATYYYRARSRGPLVAAGFSAYTATVSNTGTNVGVISGNATTAIGQVTQLPVINGGFDIAPVGYGWVADSGSGWTIDTANNTPGAGPNSAMHVGGSGNGAYRNAGLAACGPGQVYKAQGLVKAVGANGTCYVYISWCNAGGGEISSTAGNQITGTTTAGSYAVGAAPAGTVYARTCLGVGGHTSGTYYVDNVLCSQYPSSIGEVPDGGGFSKVNAAQVNQGVVTLLGTGRNAIQNPNFSQNFSGRVANAIISSGAVIDHWTITGVAANSAGYWSGSSLNIRVYAGFVIAASGTTAGPTIGSDPFAVKAGDNFALRIDRAGYASNGAPAGVSPYHRVYLSFLDSTGAVVSNQVNDAVYGGTIGPIVVTGVVPAGAVLCIARLNIYFANTGAATTWPAGFIDATLNSVEYVQAANIDNEVIDGSTYGRSVLSRLSSGVPFIDFAAGIHLNKNVDNVGDGSTYARIKGAELSSGVHKLGVAGSGALLGNQLNIPNSLTLNYGAVRSATALTASSTGAVSVNAFTYYMGAAAVNYSAVSNAVTGLTQGSTYYIYTRDPGGTGGTKTWSATTNVNALLQTYDDIVVAGQVTIPTSGSSSGGGTGGCPVVGAWVIRRTADGWAFARAGDIAEGDELLLTSGQWGRVSHSRAVLQPCVIVQDAEGFALSCSRSAPLGREDGTQVLAPDAAGELIESRTGVVKGASRIAIVRDIGDQWVQHITCENDLFWVGDEPGRLFSHHNLKP